MNISKVGVIGAGTMGSEIVQVISNAGLPVFLKDIEQNMLDSGMQKIRRIYQRRVDKGTLSAEGMEAQLALITPTLTYDGFEGVDLVIEAVAEVIEVKLRVFRELKAACSGQALFASNTSGLSISEMGAAIQQPHRVVGMHFFNPASVMKLVEVVPGLETAPATVEAVTTLAQSLGKTPVVIQECPGFVVNRLLFPYLNEAIACLSVTGPSEIDQTMAVWGWPMGPFTLMDLIGLDVCLHVSDYLIESYGERMGDTHLLAQLVEMGRLGKKSGAGFYRYDGQSDETLQKLIGQLQADKVGSFRAERLIYLLINEAALCLQEHVAGAEGIDTAMVAGSGMTYGGRRIGPLAVADEIGLEVVLAGLEQFKADYGPKFQPSYLFKLKVNAGHLGKATRRGFYEYG
jgi:3-hydroxyacyl-CoA dehydrogenase